MPARDLHDYAEPAVLRDGGSLWIRAVRPSDKPLLTAHFGRLSAESARYRFFGVKRRLSDGELAHFTELDFTNHVGLAAVLRVRGEEQLVGLGHYFLTGPA